MLTKCKEFKSMQMESCDLNFEPYPEIFFKILHWQSTKMVFTRTIVIFDINPHPEIT